MMKGLEILNFKFQTQLLSQQKIVNTKHQGIWSSGMILALGARGPEFDSRNAPLTFFLVNVNMNKTN